MYIINKQFLSTQISSVLQKYYEKRKKKTVQKPANQTETQKMFGEKEERIINGSFSKNSFPT